MKLKRIWIKNCEQVQDTSEHFANLFNEIGENFNNSPKWKCRKRVRQPENPDVDECLLQWLKQMQDKNIPLDRSLVCEKAEEISKTLLKSEYKARTGWLDGFKERYAISFKYAVKVQLWIKMQWILVKIMFCKWLKKH